MKDRVSTEVLENGAIRYAEYDSSGNFVQYRYLLPADEPTEEGSAINKANFLPDVVAEALGLDPADNPEIKDALQLISENFFNTTKYWWEKYNLVYEESLGTATTLQGVGSYYYAGTTRTLYSNPTFDPSTGEITFGNTSTYTFDTQTTTALNNWYIIFNNIVYKCSGSTTVRNVGGTYYHDVTAYPVTSAKTAQGSYVENVSDLSESAYPDKATQDDYYYISFGRPAPLPAQIEEGSYVGTGVYGSGSPNGIPFSSIPKIILLHTGSALLIAIRGINAFFEIPAASTTSSTTNFGTYRPILTWGDHALSWYSTSSASAQANTSGTTYRYKVLY